MKIHRGLIAFLVVGCLMTLGPLQASSGPSAVEDGIASVGAIVTPPEHRRGEDQTYLTYPEWFLVFSPAEHARFLREHPPSEFPFFGHIGQFWGAYAAMTAAMGDAYDFNLGYHVMVFVIGTSTTVEYALKAGYEAVFGRWFEGPVTPEDELAAFVAQDYVDFILSTPWYEYDFFAALGTLWSDTPLSGPDPLRKWERRFALTTEYLVKGLYAILIKAATQAGYEAPLPVTAVVVDRLPADRSSLTELVEVAAIEGGGYLVTLPRYDAFKGYARELAESGVVFQEIAGNRGVIVVSLLSRTPLQIDVGHELLLEQPILTEPERRRYVVRTEVSSLAPLLSAVTAAGMELEHVYDY